MYPKARSDVGNLGSELKKAYFPSGSLIDKPRPKVAPAEPKMWDFDPKRKPDGKSYLKMPPPPKDPQERTEYDKVMTIWFKLPTSVQWDIWNYTQSGQLTFAEVVQSDEVKRYAKRPSLSANCHRIRTMTYRAFRRRWHRNRGRQNRQGEFRRPALTFSAPEMSGLHPPIRNYGKARAEDLRAA
jgi:hypothetical protein